MQLKKRIKGLLGIKDGYNLMVGRFNRQYRELWIQKQLHEIGADKKILDAGAGEQPYKQFCSHLRYTSQDFAQYDGKGDGVGLQNENKWNIDKIDIVSDIKQIPVENESFDAILCTEVLEHVPDPVAAVTELSRVLKSQGVLLVTVPFISGSHQTPYHFCTGFSRYFFEYHLPNLGFDKIEIEYNGNYFEFLAQELRRSNEIATRYSHDKTRRKPSEIKSMGIILSMLYRFSMEAENSKEFMSYGLHIKALKK
jgi:SAM-dependent methyltransferase